MAWLAVVIVSWNVRDLLARALESLFADLDTSSIGSRVLVVDNASRDGSVEMLRSRFPRVELIALERNLGFAGGNNVGLRALGFSASPRLPFSSSGDRQRESTGEEEFVLLLNPDTQVQPGAIRTLLDAIRARPDAAVVTSRLSYADGSFQHSSFRFPGLAQLVIDLFPVHPRLHETRLNGRYPRRRYSSGLPFEIDHPLGAVMLVRAESIRQVGLLDEEFTLYCEEIDWCARFKEAGRRNLCVPSARVIHHAGQSTSQAPVESFVRLWTARYRLHTRHPHFAPMWLAQRIVHAGMRRKMRSALDDDMKTACQRIIEVWK